MSGEIKYQKRPEVETPTERTERRLGNALLKVAAAMQVGDAQEVSAARATLAYQCREYLSHVAPSTAPKPSRDRSAPEHQE